MATRDVDVQVSGGGTIFLFQPLSESAREWISEHVQVDAQWFGDALAVEHRFALELTRGMIRDGLALE